MRRECEGWGAAGCGLDVVSIGARGGRGIAGHDARRQWVMRHASPPNHFGGYWPDAEPLAISLLCGTSAGSRRRSSDSAAWRGRLFGVTPSGPGYYGTAQFALGRSHSFEVRMIVSRVARVRAVTYGTITAAFTILFVFITLRVLRRGDWLEGAFSAAMTAGLAWATRRWYRRFRNSNLL